MLPLALQSPSYGGLLLQLVALLVGIGASAFILFRLATRSVRRAEGALRVVAQQGLEPRRTLYVVALGERGWLVGASEAGLSTLAELGPEELARCESARASIVAAGRWWRKPGEVGPSAQPTSPSEPVSLLEPRAEASAAADPKGGEA